MHSVPRGSETHFKVVVVSDKFDNLPLVQVRSCAEDQLSGNCFNAIVYVVRLSRGTVS